jgi:hypothetical protein
VADVLKVGRTADVLLGKTFLVALLMLAEVVVPDRLVRCGLAKSSGEVRSTSSRLI